MFGYLALLIVSDIVRWVRPADRVSDIDPAITVQAVREDRQLGREVRIAYREYGSIPNKAWSTIILLHGSPGNKEDFRWLALQLAKQYRVIAPDLPGFGNSTADVSDYSIRAHARYVIELMDALGIERAHLLGFSMGGGVVLNVADIAPDRVESITMLSAIGVQEAELLGEGNEQVAASLAPAVCDFLRKLEA